MHNLTKYVRIDPAFIAYAAGSTDCESNVFDMANYEGIACHLLLGTVTTGTHVNLHAEMSTASAGTYVDVADSAAYFASTQGSSGVYLVSEVYRPAKQYVKFVADIADANVVINGGLAYRYRAGDLPVAESTYAIGSGAAIIDYALVTQGTSGSATG